MWGLQQRRMSIRPEHGRAAPSTYYCYGWIQYLIRYLLLGSDLKFCAVRALMRALGLQ